MKNTKSAENSSKNTLNKSTTQAAAKNNKNKKAVEQTSKEAKILTKSKSAATKNNPAKAAESKLAASKTAKPAKIAKSAEVKLVKNTIEKEKPKAALKVSVKAEKVAKAPAKSTAKAKAAAKLLTATRKKQAVNAKANQMLLDSKKTSAKVSKEVAKENVKESHKALAEQNNVKKAKNTEDINTETIQAEGEVAAPAVVEPGHLSADQLRKIEKLIKLARPFEEIEKFISNPVKYKMSQAYAEKMVIKHEVLGLGYVLAIENNKMKVLFRDGMKSLIMNYKV